MSRLINLFLSLQDDTVALQLPPLWSPPYSAANIKQCTKHNIKLINYNICCHLTGVHEAFGTVDGLMAESGEPLTLKDLTSEALDIPICYVCTHTSTHTLVKHNHSIHTHSTHSLRSRTTCAHSSLHTPI